MQKNNYSASWGIQYISLQWTACWATEIIDYSSCVVMWRNKIVYNVSFAHSGVNCMWHVGCPATENVVGYSGLSRRSTVDTAHCLHNSNVYWFSSRWRRHSSYVAAGVVSHGGWSLNKESVVAVVIVQWRSQLIRRQLDVIVKRTRIIYVHCCLIWWIKMSCGYYRTLYRRQLPTETDPIDLVVIEALLAYRNRSQRRWGRCPRHAPKRVVPRRCRRRVEPTILHGGAHRKHQRSFGLQFCGVLWLGAPSLIMGVDFV